jgi:hypothetical protein
MKTCLDLNSGRMALEAVVHFPAALVQALAQSGMGGAQLEQILEANLRIVCPVCGICLKPEELRCLILTGGKIGGNSPKLERLRLGYCLRNGCSSRFYDFTWKPTPGVDWPAVLMRVDHLINSASGEGPEKHRSTWECLNFEMNRWWRELPSQFSRRHAMAGFLLLLFLAIYWLQSGRPVPGFAPKARVFIVESQPN